MEMVGEGLLQDEAAGSEMTGKLVNVRKKTTEQTTE